MARTSLPLTLQPSLLRRRLLACGLASALPASASGRDCDVCFVQEADSAEFEFQQPLSPTASAFMRLALDARDFAARRGDPAFGAVIVVNATVAGAAPNRTVSRRDPTAHAEIEAIRDACRRLAVARLDGAILYTSERPCRMCELACHAAGIAHMVYGVDLTNAGPPRNEAC